MNKKTDIRAFSKEELSNFFVLNGDKAFRANQVYQWLWKKRVSNFDQMVNLPKKTRQILEQGFVINNVDISKMLQSKDGTLKSAVKLYDGFVVESVLIPTKTRTTACVSSQVGCSLDCKFCATSQLKRMRNLRYDEIFDQVYLMNQESIMHYNRRLSNIVFMGMGEPLMNYNNVLKSIDMITSDQGLSISPRRITLSSSGIPKMIKKMADDKVKFNLAVSLHSAIEQVRNKIMPFTIKFPLTDLRDSLVYWYEKIKRRVTYEYIIWKGINDREKDIYELIEFCKLLPCKVNLIEYNEIDKGIFTGASKEVVESYMDALESNGIIVNVRKSRGKDIDAACGQLANRNA